MEAREQAGALPRTLVVKNQIGGEERAPSTDTYARRNPANREDIVTVAPLTGRAEVAEACEKARAAQREWARIPSPQRAQVLARLAELLRHEKESLSRFVSREVG